MQAEITGSAQNIYFQTTQHGMGKDIDKNHLSEIPLKFLFCAKWAILALLWPKFMQAYISRSALRIFFQTLQQDKTQ